MSGSSSLKFQKWTSYQVDYVCMGTVAGNNPHVHVCFEATCLMKSDIGTN